MRASSLIPTHPMTSFKSLIFLLKRLRSTITSRITAVWVFRQSNAIAMNCWNVRLFCWLLTPVNIKSSAISIMSTMLMFTEAKVSAASLCSAMLETSAHEIIMSPSLSMSPIILPNLSRTFSVNICSFSVEEMADTTSHKTPMSMLSSVSAEITAKIASTARQTPLSALTASTKSFRLSRKVPYMNRVYMDSDTPLKYISRNSVPSDNCVKAIAKM
mmetsp:Transcript_34223/g.67373  ORF Transcript_34223/g.67373 Transcript_34223/m.67373 type:complete len:216 (+) Transcript_34223:625-1272(+)